MLEKGSFNAPDKVRSSGPDQTKIVEIGDITFIKKVLKPVPILPAFPGPTAGPELCQDPHIEFHLTGRLRVKMADGTEEEYGPGDVGVIPPGHNSKVVGNKPVTILEIIVGNKPVTILGTTEPREYTVLEIEEEKVAARRRAEDLIAAINGRNPREIANIFAERADFINAAGKIFHGRPAIERYFATYLQNLLPNNSLFRVYRGYARVIGPNLSNVDLYYNLTDTGSSLQPQPYTEGLFNLLLVKYRDELSILTMHSINLTETMEDTETVEPDETDMVIS